MPPPRRTHSDRDLFKLANRQYGLLTHAQLIAHGLEQHHIQDRLATHRLTRVGAEVYALGHTVLRDEGHWLAAQWSCGHADVLSHHTAGAFHGWRVPAADRRIHLSTTDETTTRGALVVHRVKSLPRADTFRRGPFRVTTIPRTLVDLADVLDWSAFRQLADDLPTLDLVRIRDAQDRAPGRRGRGRVRRLIEADDAHTKSELERRFQRFLVARGLPRPTELNQVVAGHRADCIYRPERLVIELDGRAYHERRAQMRADRHRDGDYQLAGYRIFRLVWDDLHADEAGHTAQRIRRLLAGTTR
ncbi:endonuclease domain-containing protein [Paraconexibacter antarcticus]|uniref:Endonuclease domain-containing protein n=1 Tax=Paraconexibacter antarcticus TaxID=2949664 RepID=A0ABY5DZF5_9ACTN|nr:DUF559 domain-containing protein [Paraconexibacter antarcticus]UTI65949.1 endonuclease domain-containing protein [Paraconexibacter antarcticus]